MGNTIDYYNKNAKTFIDGTVSVDFKHIQNMFLELLPEKARILDFGYGSGSDTKYFLEQGHIVDATDGSLELCKTVSEYAGIIVKHMLQENCEITLPRNLIDEDFEIEEPVLFEENKDIPL